ncbi:50S ribosomal protein L24e [Candidatus Woesearchaeota archaeon]|nr:50S ribosomal protein L24e [Candidatus Woesearchaeota archaeon]
MVKCEFCRNTLAAGTGKLYVKKDGKQLYFCSSKCEKNLLKLGRKPRNVTWTQEYVQNKKSSSKKAAPKAEAKTSKKKQ